MKNILFLFLLLLCSQLSAQDSKPPRLWIDQGFWTTSYTLNNDRVTAEEVQLHLDKVYPASGVYWRLSSNKSLSASVLSLASSLSLLGSVITYKKPITSLTLATSCVIFGTCSLITSSTAKRYQNKAKLQYNVFAGHMN